MNKILQCLIIGTTITFLVLSVAGIVYLVSQDTKVKSKEGFIYRLYLIDNCQYIHYDRGIAHKGDCTNTFHELSK